MNGHPYNGYPHNDPNQLYRQMQASNSRQTNGIAYQDYGMNLDGAADFQPPHPGVHTGYSQQIYRQNSLANDAQFHANQLYHTSAHAGHGYMPMLFNDGSQQPRIMNASPTVYQNSNISYPSGMSYSQPNSQATNGLMQGRTQSFSRSFSNGLEQGPKQQSPTLQQYQTSQPSASPTTYDISQSQPLSHAQTPKYNQQKQTVNQQIHTSPQFTPPASGTINPADLYRPPPKKPRVQETPTAASQFLTPPPTVKQPKPAEVLIKQSKPAEPPISIDGEVFQSLAEEYLDCARSIRDTVGLKATEHREQYGRLLSTALTCLNNAIESKLPPPQEAQLRLRYASLLFEETDNLMQAEETLSKGINMCQRHGLVSYKYEMEHLLTRITFATSSKAGLKYLDGVIRDAQAYQHQPWVYALQFLKVSLSLSTGIAHDTSIAVQEVRKIIDHAKSAKEPDVLCLARSMEAFVHLLKSTAKSSVEDCQVTLANVRSDQLGKMYSNVPQVALMNTVADQACSLLQANLLQASTHMADLQSQFEGLNEWPVDGLFDIPVHQPTQAQNLALSSNYGTLRTGQDGKYRVSFQWLQRDEVQLLAHLLNALTVASRNIADGQQSEKYLNDAITLLRDSTPSLPVDTDLTWRNQILCYLQTYLTFNFMHRSFWQQAARELDKLEKSIKALPVDKRGSPTLFAEYIRGCLLQGQGHVDHALSVFDGALLSPLKNNVPSPPSKISHTLILLSALNILMITNEPSHTSHTKYAPLLETIATAVSNSTSREPLAGWHFLSAISNQSTLKAKASLQQALNISKELSNNQFMCMTLNFMLMKFFTGVVGEQAFKSSLVASQVANKSKNPLWISVASGLAQASFEIQGRPKEASEMGKLARDMAGRLPSEMQRFD